MADARFLAQLKQFGAVPHVAAYRPGLGCAVETEAAKILVLGPLGVSFVLRRRHGNDSPLVTSGGRKWKTVGLYGANAKTQATVEHESHGAGFTEFVDGTDLQTFLAFANPAVVHPATGAAISIPAQVASRDMKLEQDETITSSQCFRFNADRRCLAVYTTAGSDNREARVLIILYDANWTHIGVTGRSPSRWQNGARVYLEPFKIRALLTIDGLHAPVFVTTDFVTECPCTEFSLHTFLADGQFGTVTVENGVVVERDDEDECVCTMG